MNKREKIEFRRYRCRSTYEGARPNASGGITRCEQGQLWQPLELVELQTESNGVTDSGQQNLVQEAGSKIVSRVLKFGLAARVSYAFL